MKLAIVGNSHAGKLFTAWKEQHRSMAHSSIDFFVNRSTGTNPLQLIGDGNPRLFNELKLIDDTTLVLHRYDAILIVGLGLGFHTLIHHYRQYRALSHRDRNAQFLVSDSFFEILTQEIVRDTDAYKVAFAAVEGGASNVFIMPQPYPMHWVLDRDGENYDVFRRLVSTGDAELLNRSFRNALVALEPRIHFFEQPAETIIDQFFTRSDLALGGKEGASDPGSLYSRGDYHHANTDYSRIVLNQLFKDFLKSFQ